MNDRKAEFFRAAAVALTAAAACALLQYFHHDLIIRPCENDLPWYLKNAGSYADVFTWNPFRTLAYPLLLRLGMDAGLTGFGTAKVIAPLSMLAFLLVCYLAARQFVGPRSALAAQALVAVNWHVSGLGVAASTDLPWAATEGLALTAAVAALRRASLPFVALAGISYDLRPTGLIAAPVLAGFFGLSSLVRARQGERRFLLSVPLFAALFLILASPQIAVNWSQQGSPFANEQARNVWFGVHGSGNWQEKWKDSAGTSSLVEVIAADPTAFFCHWIKESAKFAARIPFLAVGIQPLLITNYGGIIIKVLQLLLYGAAGLAAWWALIPGVRRLAWSREKLRHWMRTDLLLWPGYIVVYGAAVSLAFTTFRFLVVLAPFVATVMVGGGAALADRSPRRRTARAAFVILLMAMALHCGWGHYVNLALLQSASHEVEAALDRAGAGETARVAATRAGLYQFGSSRQWVLLPARLKSVDQLLDWARAERVKYLLFEEANYRSREAVIWPELTRDLLDRPPPGKVLLKRDRYLRRVLLELDLGEGPKP